MKEIQITSACSDDQVLRSLYETAFPENEQIPWTDLMRLIDEMSLDFTAYYEGDIFVGLTIVYPRKSFNWYWYFAVREELRGKGYGQRILTQLIEKYKGQASVLDMESPYQEPCPNPEQRKRRHGFYLRNGFRDTNVYRSYSDVTMTVMMMGPGTFTLQDWDDITDELKHFWWPDDLEEDSRPEIKPATKEQAADIACLIMMAMTDECCQYFCGEGYGLEDFRRMMVSLVEREDSQYSYRNTLVALHAGRVVGVSVSYDGGKLHELRRAFIESAKACIGKDHSGMDDETQAGELYLDSLAVLPEYRCQGIAQLLLKATKQRADGMGLPCVGLLVDKGNPAGEALYASVGFRHVNDTTWGGHPMKHLVL